jgi:hypothetical protein
MCPDITLGEWPGRANKRTRNQAAHRQANLLLSSQSAVSITAAVTLYLKAPTTDGNGL